MTKDNLTKLWQWISLGCFAYVVGSVISIQGGTDVFGAKFFADTKHDGREVVAYFAVIVGAGLLALSLVVATLYARRHGDAWHNRIPVIFLDGLDTKAFEAKIYQACVVIILVVVPLYGVGKSMMIANEGRICEQVREGDKPISFGSGSWKLIHIPVHTNQLRLMKHDTDKCGGSGVEIGWYTPVVFGVAPALAGLLFLIWLGFLLRRSDPSQAS